MNVERDEVRRLVALSPPVARSQFSDRVARTFLLDPDDRDGFADGLAFNARLVTQLRLAGSRLWDSRRKGS